MQIHEYRQPSAPTAGRLPTRSPVQSAMGIVAGTVLVGAGLAFAFVVSVTVLTVGAIGSAYVLWKTRAVRRELREQIEAAHRRAVPTEDGTIVEGEVIREER